MTEYSGIPNLDAMSYDELWQFWKDCGMSSVLCPRIIARAIFPEQPKGYVSTAKTLSHYAVNKATAMKCRLEGKIPAALVYEDICDKIYSDLPEYAKW